MKYNVTGYSKVSGDVITITSNGSSQEISGNTTTSINPNTSVKVTATAGTYRRVNLFVDGTQVTLTDNSYTFTPKVSTSIGIVFESFSEFEIYMSQTEELYNLAKQVVNGQV